jgi:hypothetical protein
MFFYLSFLSEILVSNISKKTFMSLNVLLFVFLRRNPWGNMSYADLITQAIKSSADQRLTLAQIYEWLVKNVSYFREKGDSVSSTGWKVRNIWFLQTSIPPELSLLGISQDLEMRDF